VQTGEVEGVGPWEMGFGKLMSAQQRTMDGPFVLGICTISCLRQGLDCIYNHIVQCSHEKLLISFCVGIDVECVQDAAYEHHASSNS
jgi:hypothetical protein